MIWISRWISLKIAKSPYEIVNYVQVQSNFNNYKSNARKILFCRPVARARWFVHGDDCAHFGYLTPHVCVDFACTHNIGNIAPHLPLISTLLNTCMDFFLWIISNYIFISKFNLKNNEENRLSLYIYIYNIKIKINNVCYARQFSINSFRVISCQK